MARKSSIDLLPNEIRDALHALLRDPAVTQLNATKRVNELLEAEGLEMEVSKSSVNRYSQRMEKMGAKIRESREVAEMWIGKLGNAPQGQVAKLLNEFVQTMIFETSSEMMIGEEPAHPKMLKELALSIKHLEAATTMNEKREQLIRKQMAEEAAETAETVAKQQGLTREGVKAIKEQILGIA